jgi:hypothetical protein
VHLFERVIWPNAFILVIGELQNVGVEEMRITDEEFLVYHLRSP